MTPAQRTALTLRAAAAFFAVSTGYGAIHCLYYLAPGLVGATVLLMVATCYDGEDRRIRARHNELRRAALAAEQLLPPQPCCSFWDNSDGMVHGPDCTRPPDARAQLDEGCCERWWTSLGTEHDSSCPATATRGRAA
ncbi:hypothetical protein AB0L67_41060 [Streptomyces flaveolus]|uniref:hypothetical protein n=1 Tax=Streptomyces flaveolus TaxID=67297 RepID=UPI003447B775